MSEVKMSNHELWYEEGMEGDNLTTHTDYCWMFRRYRWQYEFRTTDVVDREILTALGIHSKLRELHENTTHAAESFLRKLKKQTRGYSTDSPNPETIDRMILTVMLEISMIY